MRTKMAERMVTPSLGLLLLLPACGGGGGGGSGGGTDGGTAGGTAGGDGADAESGNEPAPGPAENGDQCGSDVYGWLTGCKVQDSTAWTSDREQVPGAPMAGDPTSERLCCEGSPAVVTADGGCTSLCIREICEAARLDHMNRCESCGAFDCGFDMSNCLAGGEHKQLVTCPALQWPYLYTLTASCSAFNNETRNPDGSFGFLERPVNDDTDNDPPICQPSDDQQHEPPRGLGQYKGSESDGTLARVTWSMAEVGGVEQSEELEVLFQYAIVPCEAPSNECMQLTALELTLPTVEALGMTITNARLAVISVAETPMMENEEYFDYAEGSLEVLMQAYVDDMPLVLSGRNVGVVQGLVSPAGDQISLTELRFGFDDGFISATLEIDVQGQYDARRPNAQIAHVTAPASCDEPVVLLASSWDEDQEPLTHSWWIRDVGTFTGGMVEVVLPAGEHDVMLTSFDSSGLFDTETLRYARYCQ